MDLKSELLKSIWYAFTSLEAERSGKVSKSQLKVLSHNLYTALNIPHDPVALEEHFKDNDNGPVSDHGYMPYLNKYILAKATEGTFNKETFDELCWMMTSKKNFKPSIQQGLCSQSDCFKLFCLFNQLSEDRYPLVIIQPELVYLLKKISTAMNQEWDGEPLEDLLSSDPSLQNGLSVWMFLEHLNTGRLLRVDSKEAFSLALDDIFLEMYHNVLKKGYMLKKGHVRRSWQERWFVLKPGSLAYYINEDQKEKKGEVQLDGSCVLETIPDKEGKRCLFCVKTPGRTYEMSATDQKQRVEWIQAVQTALRLKAEGKSSLHQELKLRRRDMRESSQNSPRTECPSSQSGQRSLSQSSENGQRSLSQSSENGQRSLSQSSENGQRSLSQSSENGQRSLSQSSENGQRSLSQSSQSEQCNEAEESSSGATGQPGSKEPDLEIIDIIQQHLEMEVQRKKEDALEKEKQKERQQELERQVEKANKAKEDMVAVLTKMEREVQQQKLRIQELELTQQKLEEALNTQIQARLEEEKVRHELERLLEEERKKLSALILNQRQLETHEYSEIAQEKTTPLQKDEDILRPPLSPVIAPSSSSPSPSPASSSSPITRQILCPSPVFSEAVETQQTNVEKVSEHFSKAPHMRQWNVQLNRLMKPITPADKMARLSVRSHHPKHGQALTSTEFIVKYQSTVAEAESSSSQLRKTEEDVGTGEPITASRVEEPPKTSGQVELREDFA